MDLSGRKNLNVSVFDMGYPPITMEIASSIEKEVTERLSRSMSEIGRSDPKARELVQKEVIAERIKSWLDEKRLNESFSKKTGGITGGR